ncbi:hypothetical protein [Geminocystis sp. NIES-3709]|uniref:hypothetical protein n=1 Tax=Geminocystis sp. NIES-3709 TaxID=1617448 RepID=UPI0005FC61F2|nr:hypothetical protein [Geminocystis sp. NIES-3709]BAQ63981.1 hypothetical protein GM3709_746 [Geminocystis sp. NIES-3709]
MASETEVKKYLAYWFQLGKKIIIPSRNISLLPSKIISGDRYSVEFEECWALIAEKKTGDCYLEGTVQSIQELLSPKWDITNCYRCDMPIPMIEIGVQDSNCVCSDVEGWPNNELPKPRNPIDNQKKLEDIKKSLQKKIIQTPKKFRLNH